MTDDKTPKPVDPTADADRHAMKMAKKKVARDKIMATKTDKKGLVIVHTGKGTVSYTPLTLPTNKIVYS